MKKSNRQLNVVVGVLERDGLIFVGRRVAPERPEWHNKWELPGGKIEAGETPEEAVIREIKEETSLTVTQSELIGIHVHNWELEDSIQQTFLVCYRCQVADGEVELRLDEHDLYEWIDPTKLSEVGELLSGAQEIISDLYLPKVEQSLVGAL